jgi:hypothetical protein
VAANTSRFPGAEHHGHDGIGWTDGVPKKNNCCPHLGTMMSNDY